MDKAILQQMLADMKACPPVAKQTASVWGFKDAHGGATFMTPKNLSKALQISMKTLERMRNDGTGPKFIRAGNKHIRYPIAKLDQWINSRVENEQQITTTSNPSYKEQK